MNNGQHINLITVNTLGMAILVDAFKCASKMFGDTASLVARDMPSLEQNVYTYKECVNSLAFIKGSGLEIMLDEYFIPLNADSLRGTFFTMFNHREHIE